MKKQNLALIGGIGILSLGGIAVFHLNRSNVSVVQSTKAKQLAYLKEHEKEIIEWIKSKYPKIESVQFDWDTLRVGPVSNGIVTTHYNLSIIGTFNNLENTKIGVDFHLEKETDIPDVKKIGMLSDPIFLKDRVWWIYD